MNELALLTDEEQEFDDMGSYNHSTVQANLAFLLKRLGTYSVSIELSLDSSLLDSDVYHVKDELIPDLCLYPKRELSLPFDILKMADMPLLAVEVLSPRQFTTSILNKFNAYFALGIKSCWLIDPATRTVHVYASMTRWRSFAIDDTLEDKVLDIQLTVREIFEG